MKKKCHVFIDEEPYSFEVEGKFFWGENKLLFNKEDNLISKMRWKDDGYRIVEAFNEDSFLKLKASITKIIVNAIKLNTIDFDEDSFTLSKYHEVINTDELHNKIINITRNLENSNLDFDVEILVKHFSKILGYNLTSWLEEINKSHIQIRISRPNSLDINPPHRDSYLSYYKDILNIWIPIEGCNENSSLPVFSGSHLIPENEVLRTESKGATINNNTYYVPCILQTKEGEMKLIRPNPKVGEALIFSPYLIHGAAVNKNKNITRVSLELRFARL